MSRTRPCGEREARVRLDHARHFLEVAEIVHDETVDASLNVTAALCVLAGIAASDAACCAALQERARGESHQEAERLVARIPQVGADMARALRRLLNIKDEAHYGVLYVSRHKTDVAFRQAKRLVELSERAVVR